MLGLDRIVHSIIDIASSDNNNEQVHKEILNGKKRLVMCKPSVQSKATFFGN
jgi:hypothetical protein